MSFKKISSDNPSVVVSNYTLLEHDDNVKTITVKADKPGYKVYQLRAGGKNKEASDYVQIADLGDSTEPVTVTLKNGSTRAIVAVDHPSSTSFGCGLTETTDFSTTISSERACAYFDKNAIGTWQNAAGTWRKFQVTLDPKLRSRTSCRCDGCFCQCQRPGYVY